MRVLSEISRAFLVDFTSKSDKFSLRLAFKFHITEKEIRFETYTCLPKHGWATAHSAHPSLTPPDNNYHC